MGDNPLFRVHPKSFAQVRNVKELDISKSKFRGEHQDEFKFLIQLVNMTRLNLTECFEENDCSTLAPFPAMIELNHLEVAKIGLISAVGIVEKFPRLCDLDLRGNKIFSMDTLE